MDRQPYAADAAGKIADRIKKAYDNLKPYRAIAKSESGGKVEILRLDATQEDTELYGRIAGFALPVDAEVVCLNYEGQPLILGILQHTPPTLYTLPTATQLTNSGAILYSGSGSPEGVVTAVVGSYYFRTGGGSIAALYFKETGTGNTGWVLTSGGLQAYRRTYKAINANPTLATVTAIGMTAPSIIASIATNADDADGSWLGIVTSAVSGNDAWIQSSPLASLCRPDWLPEVEFVIKTGASITSGRWWIGLFDGDPTAGGNPVVNAAGFRYDTALDGGALWRSWTNDAVSTGTSMATVIAVVAATKYKMRIKFLVASIEFYIDDVLLETHTTNLPTATAMLGINVSVSCLTASARAISLSRVSVVHSP